jgi:hypothetical protein
VTCATDLACESGGFCVPDDIGRARDGAWGSQ